MVTHLTEVNIETFATDNVRHLKSGGRSVISTVCEDEAEKRTLMDIQLSIMMNS